MLKSHDPYREPAPVEVDEIPHRWIGEVLRRLGLWHFAFVRQLLGGRWEYFVAKMHVRLMLSDASLEATIPVPLERWVRVRRWSATVLEHCKLQLFDQHDVLVVLMWTHPAAATIVECRQEHY